MRGLTVLLLTACSGAKSTPPPAVVTPDVDAAIDATPPDAAPIAVTEGPPREVGLERVPYGADPPPDVLDANEIMKTLAKHEIAMKHCYKAALKRDPKTQFALAFKFTIGKDGKVKNARAPTAPKELGECLSRALSKIIFVPPPADEIEMNYPGDATHPLDVDPVVTPERVEGKSLMKAIMVQKAELAKCYDDERARDPDSIFTLAFTLKVGKKGKLESVSASPKMPKQFGECLVRVFKKVKTVPAPEGIIEVSYPLH